MESIQRRFNTKKLVVPEPTYLWTSDLRERKRFIIEAKGLWAMYRSSFGFKIPTNVNSLNFGTVPEDNQKFGKSKELIFGLSLAQANLSGINVCHWSTPECRKNCVGQNGNNGYAPIMRAKIAKTRFLFEHPKEAGICLADFWTRAKEKIALGYVVGGRLNTYSDISWQVVAPWIFERFPDINYFDYTKDFSRESIYKNYHLTYSASERTTDDEIIDLVSRGKNVAVVFSSWSSLPTEYLGLPVIDGDATDVRWKDPIGCVVGLKRKGTLRANSPMVRSF